MCVQVWAACLSADGRPHSGGSLLCVPLISGLYLLLRCSFFFSSLCRFFFMSCEQFESSPPTLTPSSYSSGVTPAVSPAPGRAGETAAAVPAVTACRRERALLTPSAQTVSQPSSAISRWLSAARLICCSLGGGGKIKKAGKKNALWGNFRPAGSSWRPTTCR